MNKLTIHMLAHWPLTSYLYCLNCPIHTSKTNEIERKRIVSLTSCSVFNNFLSHTVLQKYRTENKTKEVFSLHLLAVLASPIPHLTHLLHEPQKRKKIIFKNSV